MDYDYIRDNLNVGIKHSTHFEAATAQIAFEQLRVLTRIANHLDRGRDAERDAKRDAVKTLPIYQYLMSLTLPTRLHNLIHREMSWGRWPELAAMTLEEFTRELDQPNGGRLQCLLNLGKVGIAEIRRAVCAAEPLTP